MAKWLRFRLEVDIVALMATKDNTLLVGQSRIGLMIDGLPETPRVAVKLERTASRVEVTIPFLDGNSDLYEYWFSGNTMYGDDPGRSKRRYEPPQSISFYDSAGPVGLVGTRISGSRVRYGSLKAGEGHLTFDYTIIGAESGRAYEKLNGLRSEVEGLGTWIGLRALAAEQETEKGRLASVNLRLKSPPAIKVGQPLNAQLQANWRYGPGPGADETTIAERMQIHTQVARSVTWDHHLRSHFALRDLLRIAAWRDLNFVSHEAMSHLDPIRTQDGSTHGHQWLPVITNRTGIGQRANRLTSTDFLFLFPDVGAKGVSRWVRLSQQFKRGVSPLVGLLDLEGATVEAHLAQAGIGFEMLGYDLLLEASQSKAQAKSAHFAEQVRAVSSSVADVLPFSAEDFPNLLRHTYIGVKHADKALPDRGTMNLAYAQAIQVFRAWVGLRLGVPKAKLTGALERDAMTRRIKALQAGPESA